VLQSERLKALVPLFGAVGAGTGTATVFELGSPGPERAGIAVLIAFALYAAVKASEAIASRRRRGR